MAQQFTLFQDPKPQETATPESPAPDVPAVDQGEDGERPWERPDYLDSSNKRAVQRLGLDIAPPSPWAKKLARRVGNRRGGADE